MTPEQEIEIICDTLVKMDQLDKMLATHAREWIARELSIKLGAGG